MTQYCRYCDYATKGAYVCKCAHYGGRTITRMQAKHTNNCKHFKFNPVDVLRENVKGYKPAGRKVVQFGGLGEQISMEDIFNV